MSVFKSEADVRRWVAKHVDVCWWVEHARGGTAGFPDVVVPCNGQAVFLELKAGEWKDGCPTLTVGVPQIAMLCEMLEVGIPAGALVGMLDSDQVILAHPAELTDIGGVGSSRRRRMRADAWTEVDGSTFLVEAMNLERK